MMLATAKIRTTAGLTSSSNLKALATGVLCIRDTRSRGRRQNTECRMTRESHGETVAARLIHDVRNNT